MIGIDEIRSEFPVTEHVLYLDSAHQTPLAKSVRDALDRFYTEGEEMGGPKSVWLERVKDVRRKTAEFIGAREDDITFTKNTSEGLNIVANGISFTRGDNVVLVDGDHPNNAYAWLNLREKGVEVRFARVADDAIANAETFGPYVDARTRVISLSHVTFHAGQRHDIGDIGEMCERLGIFLVVDAMQSAGVLPIDVRLLKVSALSAGCHKGLLTPQGIGFLYVDPALKEIRPTYAAMSSMKNPPSDFIAQQNDLEFRGDGQRFETGNLNLPGLHALGASIDLLSRIGIEKVEKHLRSLGDLLLERLQGTGIELIGPTNNRGRAHIYVLKLPVSSWVKYLSDHTVRVSPERGGVRISFGIFNNRLDVEKVVEIIKRGQIELGGGLADRRPYVRRVDLD